MTSFQIAPPQVLAVSLDDAKTSLRIDGTDLDALVTIWVKGIIKTLEQQIGQCLMEQTWRVVLDAFPRAVSADITLPHPALTVTSVKYIDVGGIEQTMPDTAFKLNRERYCSTLTPKTGTSWPATAVDRGVVTIELQCGYGDTPVDTPESCQLYILAKLVEQFDPAARAERDTVQSAFIDRLLDDCKSK